MKLTKFISFQLAVLFVTLQLVVAQEVEVTIKKYFGSIEWSTGSGEKSVTCVATGAETQGYFQWLLGSEVIRTNEEGIPIDDNEYEDVLTIQPEIEQDSKILKCKYIQSSGLNNAETESDELQIKITSSQFPESPINAGTYPPDQEIEFTVEFELYPAPDEEDIKWVVENSDGEVTKFSLGDNDDQYRVGDLKSEGGNKFSTSFTIKKATADDLKKKHYLSVVEKGAKALKHMTYFKFELSDGREAAPEDDHEGHDDGEKQSEDEKPQAAGMNIGVIIILALVVVIIVICIGYCLYKKYGRQPEPKTQQYQQTPQTDPENPKP